MVDAFAVDLTPPDEGGLTFIEQLHAVSVQLCPNPKVPYLSAERDKVVYLTRGSCKLWSCPTCGARKGKQWLARLLHHMNAQPSPRWYFLTITAHPKMRGTEASVKNLRQGWKKFYNRLRRKIGTSDYVKVWEFHHDIEDDLPSFHLHVLINKKVSKKWVKDNSAECGMGYMCDSSKSKNAGMVAGYCAKYLLKSFEFAEYYPKGLRRIQCSQSWSKLPELKDDSLRWTRHEDRDGQDYYARYKKANGYIIKDLRKSESVVDEIVKAYIERVS